VQVASIDINDMASQGVIVDQPPYQLPPEAWSVGLNVRAVDEGVERLFGWSQVFGTLLFAPHFVFPVRTPSVQYWIYANLTNVAVYDGATHTDITRLGPGYNASDTPDWNSVLLGGVPILNNGVDVPQMWSPTTPGTKLVGLTNWPANLRAKVVRALGPHLVALNLIEAGNSFPHAVQWSHPADPGSVPVTWDITDPTHDAGRNDLGDVNAGVLVDALPLQSSLYLYKEGSVWRQSFIGGRFVFDFKTMLETTGILAPRCVTLTSDGLRHVFATQDADLVWHNGNTIQSILDKKVRRAVQDDIDPVNFVNSFVFTNPRYSEVWFCYPSGGATYPNRAVIWNSKNGNAGVYEADGITFRHAAIGNVEAGPEDLWEDDEVTWEGDELPWAAFQRRRVLLAGTDSTKLMFLDDGLTRDGAAYTATLQRSGLALIGRKRSGEWIEDHQQVKMASRLWPKLQGGPVNIRLGIQSTVNGTVTWTTAQAFDPTTTVVKDFGPLSGRALAIEYQTTASTHWRLDGYKYEIEKEGEF
jgi:hypothetical protein